MYVIRSWSGAALIAVLATASAGAQQAQNLALRAQPDDSARGSALDRPAHLQVEAVPLEKALTELYEKSGVPVTFSPSRIPDDLRVSCACRKQTVGEALDLLLAETPFRYRTVEGHVLILDLPSDPQISPSEPPFRLAAIGNPVTLRRMVQQPPASVVATITGRVTDAATQQPLVGVTVTVIGSGRGSVTDAAGTFTITGVPAGAHRVRATMIGYGVQERTVTVADGQSATVSFALQAQAVELEGIVAVGYGTVRRQDVTGAVAQVSADRIEDRAVTRVEQALTGQMAGVQVRQVSGEPGAPLEVRVRGSASISAGSDPLYVIDGIPVEDLGRLNPADIASIEVLKDAASAAIYGSRGANGVVLVTTKNGRAGRPQFQFSTSQGIQTLENKLDLLSGEEWIDVYRQLQDSAWTALGRRTRRDYKASDPVEFRQQELRRERHSSYIADPRWANAAEELALIDWQDEFYRPAAISTYNISGSGGSEDLRYRVSSGYLTQDGIAAFTSFNRFNLQANLDARLNDVIRMGLSLAPTLSWGSGGNVNGKDQQAHQVVAISPVAEPDVGIMTAIKPNDRYNWAGSPVSPVGFQQFSTNDTERKQLFSKLYVGADLLPGLDATVTGAWNSNMDDNIIYYPTMVQRGGANRPDGDRSDGRFRTTNSDEYLLQSTLGYDRSFGGHSVNTLLGSSLEYLDLRRSYQRHTRFGDDLLTVLNQSTSTVNNSETSALERSLVSYFGRVIYNYEGKYLASATLRRDGSSKFGENNKWGTFPSFSLGWRLSEEPFMRSADWLSNLKLRYSWGITGNNQISDYAAYGRMGVYNYSFGNDPYIGYGPSTLSNAALGWEQTHSSDLGLEVGLFDERISFTADYYNKLTSDLLLRVPVALATGFATGWQNIGQVRNEGLEFELTGRTSGVDFRWETSGNLAFNRNEVVKLGPGNAPIYTGFSGQTAIIQVGEPLMAYYMYDAIGVYMNAEDLQNSPRMARNVVGDVKYRDVNGDGVITADDRTILGHRDPQYVWGLHNGFEYKNLDFSFLLQGQGGNKIYGILGRAIDRPGMGASGNKLGRWRNRWKSEAEPGDGRTPRIDGTTGSFYDSRWLYDATYLRLRNAQIGFTLPSRLLRGAGPTRLYLSGENLFLRHNYYGGYSPEAENNSGGDYGGYPIARTFSLGISTSF